MRLDLLSKVAHRPKILPLSFPATWRITKTTEKKSSAELRRAKPQDAASHRGKKSGEKRKLHNNPSLPHPDPHPYPQTRKKNERGRKYHFKTFCGSNLVSGATSATYPVHLRGRAIYSPPERPRTVDLSPKKTKKKILNPSPISCPEDHIHSPTLNLMITDKKKLTLARHTPAQGNSIPLGEGAR